MSDRRSNLDPRRVSFSSPILVPLFHFPRVLEIADRPAITPEGIEPKILDRARVTFSARILRNDDTTRFDRVVRGEFEEATCGNRGLPFGETGTPVGV